jgi:hypothetical protein
MHLMWFTVAASLIVLASRCGTLVTIIYPCMEANLLVILDHVPTQILRLNFSN